MPLLNRFVAAVRRIIVQKFRVLFKNNVNIIHMEEIYLKECFAFINENIKCP